MDRKNIFSQRSNPKIQPMIQQNIQPMVNKFLIDKTNINHTCFLVKLPKYMSKAIEEAPSDTCIYPGEIRMFVGQHEPKDIKLILNDRFANMNLDEKIPIEHNLYHTKLVGRTAFVFSEQEHGPSRINGNCLVQLDCRPIVNSRYTNLKKEAIRKASEPSMRVQKITAVVQNYKPIRDHAFNIEYRRRLKDVGKRVRDEKDVVLSMLFNAFEKHQYYAIHDLQKITNQPMAYLKDILSEIAEYNMKKPHTRMWELKKEYRHYNAKQRIRNEFDEAERKFRKS